MTSVDAPDSMNSTDGTDLAQPPGLDAVVAKVVDNSPINVKQLIQTNPIQPIPARRGVYLMRKTDEAWLASKNGRWVKMLNALRLRNETEYRLKEPMSNLQTVSDMCQTLEYALRTETKLSFLKHADRLPKFCIVLDIGDEQWFLHSSRDMLIGTLVNLDSEHGESGAFEQAYTTLLNEFEALHNAATDGEQLSLVLFYAQARNSPCHRRYFELRVVARKQLTASDLEKRVKEGLEDADRFDVDIGHRLITSQRSGELRRYVGRSRQRIELQRLKHAIVPHSSGEKQSLETIVNNQLKCMLQKLRSHFIIVDADQEPIERMPRPQSPSFWNLPSEDTHPSKLETDRSPDNDAKKTDDVPSEPKSTCRRCQTTLDVMHSKTQMFQRTLDEARASLSETIERETTKTRQVEQKMQAMQLLNQNMTECHHQELANMRAVVDAKTAEIERLTTLLAEKEARIRQDDLIIHESASQGTKKKRRGKKRDDSEPSCDQVDETSLDALQVQVQQLKCRLANAEDECAELQLQVNESDAKLLEAVDSLDSSKRRETALEEQCTLLQSMQASAETALEESKSVADKSTQELQSLKASHQKNLKSLTKKHDAEKKQLQQSLKALTSEKDDLREQLKHAMELTETVKPIETQPSTQCVESIESIEPKGTTPLEDAHATDPPVATVATVTNDVVGSQSAPEAGESDCTNDSQCESVSDQLSVSGQDVLQPVDAAKGGKEDLSHEGTVCVTPPPAPSSKSKRPPQRVQPFKPRGMCSSGSAGTVGPPKGYGAMPSRELNASMITQNAYSQYMMSNSRGFDQSAHVDKSAMPRYGRPMHMQMRAPKPFFAAPMQPMHAQAMHAQPMPPQPMGYQGLQVASARPSTPQSEPHFHASAHTSAVYPPYHNPLAGAEYGTMYEGAPGTPCGAYPNGYTTGYPYDPHMSGGMPAQWMPYPSNDEYYTPTDAGNASDVVLDDNNLVRAMTGGANDASQTQTAMKMLARLKAVAKTQRLSAEEIREMLLV